MGSRSPLDGQRQPLRGMSFLTHEMTTAAGSAVLHEYDKVGAFSSTFDTAEQWITAMPAIWSKMNDLAPITLDSSWFYETVAYITVRVVLPFPLASTFSTLRDFLILPTLIAMVLPPPHAFPWPGPHFSPLPKHARRTVPISTHS